MQNRTGIFSVYISLLLLTIARSQRSNPNSIRLDAHSSLHDKEIEQNLNNLQNEQLFLPNKNHSPHLLTKLNKDILEWITLPTMTPLTNKHGLTNKYPDRYEKLSSPLEGYPVSQDSKLSTDKIEWVDLSRLNPFTHKKLQQIRPFQTNPQVTIDHYKWKKLRNRSPYQGRATRGFDDASRQIKHNSKNKFHQKHHPDTPAVYPRGETSRFWMRRNKGTMREQFHSQEFLPNKRRTQLNSRKYLMDLPKSLHRLDLGSHRSLQQKGRQRSERSSCTNGKVWRRGQCRCPSLSNWDEKKSECVCIYGTYKDANGNCRSFL